MQQYTGFASVYDLFMDNVPYDDWVDYILRCLKRYHIEEGLVLELGCGTGSITRRLAAKGYDMIGIDASEEMLSIAREKSVEREKRILYLCQDMREIELFGTVAAAISVCGSMNYILTEEDMIRVFRLVNNYLDQDGLFIFDLDTPYAYEKVVGDTTIAENREEGSFIWENTYYAEEMINEIQLTLYIPEEDHDEDFGVSAENSNISRSSLYRRQEETHFRRAYSLETVKRLIEEAGMEWVVVYDAFTEQEPDECSERVYIIAREKRQEGKLYTPS